MIVQVMELEMELELDDVVEDRVPFYEAFHCEKMEVRVDKDKESMVWYLDLMMIAKVRTNEMQTTTMMMEVVAERNKILMKNKVDRTVLMMVVLDPFDVVFY